MADNIKGYSGSKTVQGVGGAMTNGGITQNGVDYIAKAPQLKENVYGGGAVTRQGTIQSSDPTSPYYQMPAPSVLSDSNIREKVIPDIQNRANQLIGSGVTTTQNENQQDTESAPTLPEDDYAKIYAGILGNQSVENDPAYKADMSLIDSMKSSIDQQFNSTVDSIKIQYQTLRDNLKKAQEESTQGINNSFIRSGASRYSPFSSSAILQAKVTSDINDLSDLQAKENSLIAQAASSRQEKQYQLLDKQLSLIQNTRKEKNALAQKITDDIMKKNQEARKAQIQATRDSAIASLVQQGITDPKQVLDLLNSDEKGNTIGDFTAKEVEETLKHLSPTGDLEKLSGTTRDFYILKGKGLLPEEISSLPEGEQLFAYLAKEKRASTISGQKAGTKNVLTYKEVTDRKLPVSLVGMAEEDVYASLYDSNPPHWFIEKLQNEMSGGNDGVGIQYGNDKHLLPQAAVVAKETWDKYRQAVIANEKEVKKTTNYNKAKQYFSETYDGLEETQLDAIATQVETYVNGGMSYADAVEQTKKDLE